MIDDIRRLLDDYLTWLRDKTSLRQVNETWVEITTPYLDRHNDCTQIYVKREGGGYLLTDDGNTIQDLEDSGCALNTEKRQALLRVTLNGFGVKLNNGALEVGASEGSFSLRKHNLVQAMLAVNDLFYLAAPTVASLFYEDVEAWLNQREIRYTPKVKFSGKSGYDHLFDFVIPKSRTRPERILRAINHPNRDAAESMAWSWLDTQGVRPSDSKAFAILNDSERPVPPGVPDALRNYGVGSVLWSERESAYSDFAA